MVEAADLLRDQTFSPNLGAVLRKLKPTRQVECVELMVSTNNITTVGVLTTEGRPDSSESAQRILRLLSDDLK